MLSDKGTENSKQLVTTESPLKKIIVSAKKNFVGRRVIRKPKNPVGKMGMYSPSKCRRSKLCGLEVKQAKLHTRKNFNVKLKKLDS